MADDRAYRLVDAVIQFFARVLNFWSQRDDLAMVGESLVQLRLCSVRYLDLRLGAGSELFERLGLVEVVVGAGRLQAQSGF